MKTFLFAFLLAFPAWATTYYIDFNAANDSANGTSTSTPWKRHPYMVGFTGSYSHSAGDRFIFKGGVTWPSTVFRLTPTAGGSAGNPDYYGVDITYFTGGSWTKPIWSDSGTSATSMLATWPNSIGYITLDNIFFTGLFWNDTGSSARYAFLAFGTEAGIKVSNCRFSGWSYGASGDDALTCIGAATYEPGIDLTVTNCVFDGSGPGSGSGYAIYGAGGTGAGMVIQHCIITNMPNGAVINGHNCVFTDNDVRRIQGSVSGVHENAFEDNNLQGTLLVSNNVIGELTSGCVSLVLGGAGASCTVINNVIYGGTAGSPGAVTLECRYTPKASAKIYNNTIIATDPALPCIVVVPGGVALWGTLDAQNNHFVSDTGAFGTNGVTFDNQIIANNILQTLSTCSAQGYITNNLFAPTASGSGSVGAGGSLSSFVATDRLGVARPQGGSWDVGAYEFTGGVPVAPSITVQPANQLAIVGQAATFTVTASGDAPLAYQWSFNGNSVGGATLSSYTRSNCQLADSGKQLTVFISNAAGNVTSSAATLTVIPVPTIGTTFRKLTIARALAK